MRVGREQGVVEQQRHRLAGLTEHLGEGEAEQQRHLVASAVGDELQGKEVGPLAAAQADREAVGVDVDRVVALVGEQRQPAAHRGREAGGDIAVHAPCRLLDVLAGAA